MTWLTWRLQRTEFALLGVMLAILIAMLAQTHGENVARYASMAGSNCSGPFAGTSELCPVEIPQLSRLLQFVNTSLPWFNFLPLIASLLLALPIVNELESGTYRLAWTQGVSRQHWTRIKIGMLSLSGLIFAAIFTFTFHWWSAPIDRVDGRLGRETYDLHGTLPIGHTLFAIGLMLAIGVALRRTVPAIFLASVLYLGVRIPFMIWARPHLVSPLKRTAEINEQTITGGEWGLSSYWVDSAGNRVSDQRLFGEICSQAISGVGQDTLGRCIKANGMSIVETYHPASHYWPLQLIETGIFLVAGLALVGFSVWYLLRRIE